jgi:hypothetical protein
MFRCETAKVGNERWTNITHMSILGFYVYHLSIWKHSLQFLFTGPFPSILGKHHMANLCHKIRAVMIDRDNMDVSLIFFVNQ